MASSDNAVATIQQICQSLSSYYAMMNHPYDQNFSNYCEDNGFDEECIQEEFDDDECGTLPDFDDDFPYPDQVADDEKESFKIKKLKYCYTHPGCTFDDLHFVLPNLDANLFDDITTEDIDAIKELYKKQCPTLYNHGMSTEYNLLHVLAIGRKHNLDYIQNLVDIYDRDRVKRLKDNPEAKKCVPFSLNVFAITSIFVHT